MNLVFDMDDTLYNQLSIFESAYDEVFKRYDNFNVADIFRENVKYAGECFEKKEAGIMTTEEMYRYRITKAFSDYSVNISTEDSVKFQQSYMKHQKLIKITEGIEEVLDYGKENNITMAIITNGPDEHQTKKINLLGLNRWFDEEHIFISGCLKIAKPDIGIFKHVEDKLNLNIEHTYYVGDSLTHDVIGAKKAGWKMIWMNRMNNELPKDFPVVPDYIINDDRDLVKLLKKLL